jgi:hypothetical protein
LPNPGSVSAGVATDVGNEYFQALHGEFQVEWPTPTYSSIINIAVNAAGGFEGFEFIKEACIAEITCVPDFVAILEIVKYLRIKIGVGVREEADLHGKGGNVVGPAGRFE